MRSATGKGYLWKGQYGGERSMWLLEKGQNQRTCGGNEKVMHNVKVHIKNERICWENEKVMANVKVLTWI